MRWIVVAVIIVVSGILCWSNWQPITLYFLGNSAQTALLSLSLPLALWVLLFTLAGFITGFFIQVLNRLVSASPTPRRPRQRVTSPPPQPMGVSPNSERDWEQQRPNEWDIEEPPHSPTQTSYSPPPTPKNPDPPPQDRFKAESPSVAKSSEQTPLDAEVKASSPPQKTTREGSVYTYTYREKGDRPAPPTANSSDQVYDANYRVITPPSNEPEPEEDWI
ncbi:MAG: hypothetical protein AB4041_13660 [Microcystaceae cyanobacterium]